MNRTQKKCLVASSGFHTLLLLILFIGPAFLSPKDKPDNLPLLTFIPVITTDAEVQGGGNPKARPPAPTPPAPEPPKPEVKESKPAPTPREPKPEAKRRLPDINLVPKFREGDAKATPKPMKPSNDSRANTTSKAREQVNNAVARLQESLSGTTTVELPGPGGGGLPYANFLQAVKTVYSDAWEVPDGVTDDSATTTASVTIARDGSVISTRIIQSSGNALADHSVQATLNRVRFVAPLPKEEKENQRTVTIRFNVRSKRLIG